MEIGVWVVLCFVNPVILFCHAGLYPILLFSPSLPNCKKTSSFLDFFLLQKLSYKDCSTIPLNHAYLFNSYVLLSSFPVF